MTDKRKILIVDDSTLIRKILFNMLKEKFEILQAANGREALKLLSENEDVAAILLDLLMPEMDGFQFMIQYKKNKHKRDVPIIVITAEESEEYISMAYDVGAFEVLGKPFNNLIVRTRILNSIEFFDYKNNLENEVFMQNKSLQEFTKKLEHSNEAMLDALSSFIEYHDNESGYHVKRVRNYVRILMEKINSINPKYALSKADIEMIASASATHDIGKITIPDSVLLKPAKLSADEFEIMKTHTTKGAELLEKIEDLQSERYGQYCHDICLYHHERYDGKGYPTGLAGEAIPIWAQAVSIVDAYDALTHKRIYKEAFPQEKAVEMIVNGDCGAFSNELVQCFVECLPMFKKLSRVYEE